MTTRWDWANDRQFIEWISELVGVKVGLAPGDEELRKVVAEHDHLLSDNASQKEAKELLGRSALEAFGLDGAMRALRRSIIPAVQDRIGDFDTSILALAFVAGRIYRPSDEDAFLQEITEENAVALTMPFIHVDSTQEAEIIREAAAHLGGTGKDAVEIVLDEIAFRARRNVILAYSQRMWGDILDLSELFRSESVMATYGRFFDQRFVHYLATNFEEIGAVNWRKFEALVAEYFHRRGFNVELGAGRNDNGVDIRVWEADAREPSPPTLIVQCKREQRKIEKVVVKALAADVEWENATQGLLVATADWSPGAREVVATRNYPVTEVNREALQRWLFEMRRPDRGPWLPR